MTPLETAWERVCREAARLRPIHLRELFADDPSRFERFSYTFEDVTLDLSKEKLDTAALDALLALARTAEVESRREAMFLGTPVNETENRAALHMALRGGAAPPPGDDVERVRADFLAFAESVREGRFTDVINIGIGGSDLGPAMAVRALSPDADGPRVHFVSNVDGAHLADTLRGLDPASTMVIVASKTFTTLESMTNARSARAWLGDQAAANMAAVSTNLAACSEFGIPRERVFGFWDWVGGRYSLWSAIGLSLAIAVGTGRFEALLAGAAAMDRHFRETPLKENLPVLLALTGIWRRNAMGWPTVALIPYDQRLERFPAYVQQLEMESNGKRVTRGGAPTLNATGPVVWGEPGTNAQHSFFQLLHQGSDVIPVDFIAAACPRHADGDHHALLLANCLAQSAALAFGRTEEEARAGLTPTEAERLAPHRTFPGDRPSTTVLYRRLDAFALGRLIALYEHKVFTMGIIWGINSFDQFGVELGKVLAQRLAPVMRGESEADAGLDSSTAGLVTRIKELGR
ncbi:MAG: glucose-6-phosphate isomerase [bacterium]|nr:glucose-6-phosphate isomerase [bacterium]MDE0239445.1 glucose-6-phosphate isomerase [bacterium]MDE0415485.1 glucose-6-phosphate isomerase [bacterium]